MSVRIIRSTDLIKSPDNRLFRVADWNDAVMYGEYTPYGEYYTQAFKLEADVTVSGTITAHVDYKLIEFNNDPNGYPLMAGMFPKYFKLYLDIEFFNPAGNAVFYIFTHHPAIGRRQSQTPIVYIGFGGMSGQTVRVELLLGSSNPPSVNVKAGSVNVIDILFPFKQYSFFSYLVQSIGYRLYAEQGTGYTLQAEQAQAQQGTASINTMNVVLVADIFTRPRYDPRYRYASSSASLNAVEYNTPVPY